MAANSATQAVHALERLPKDRREDSPRLRQLMCDLRDGKASHENVVREFRPLLLRVARAATFRFGIRDELAQDVAQELSILLPKLAEGFKDAFAVEPLLIEVAKRIAYGERNRAHRRREITPFFDGDRTWGSADTATGTVSDADHRISLLVERNDPGRLRDSSPDQVSDLDRQSAIAEFGRKMYDLSRRGAVALGNVERPTMSANDAATTTRRTGTMSNMTESVMPGFELVKGPIPLPAVVTKLAVQNKRRELTHDQQELVRIRNRLGMSQPEFSAALSALLPDTPVNVPRLSAYEYGRTQKVPQNIMEAARTLFKEGERGAKKRSAPYANKTMPQILNAWASKMHIHKDDTATLAECMGTTETTIRRWRDNKARPNIQALIRYESIVQAAAKKIMASANASSQLVRASSAPAKKPGGRKKARA